MSNDSLVERQEDELKALQAIFEPDDVTDLRSKDVWQIHRAPEVCLKLRPQQSMGGACMEYTHIDLLVKCPTDYPDSVPHLQLLNPKGLSTQQMSRLQENIDKLAGSLIGEVMILELAQYVQSFLHEHNQPPPVSFYEEMMTNKRKQEELWDIEQQKQSDLMKRKEEQERQQLEYEVLRRQEAMREETKKRREEARQLDEVDSSQSDPSALSGDSIFCSPILSSSRSFASSANEQRNEGEANEAPRPVRKSYIDLFFSPTFRRTSTPKRTDDDDDVDQKCPDHCNSVKKVTFSIKGDRSIQTGKCLGHSLSGSSVYVGMDTSSGELVTVSEWVLKWRHMTKRNILDTKWDEDKETDEYCKKVSGIEQELMTLLRLRHKHLVHILSFKSVFESGQITVYILMEHVGGGNLGCYLSRKRPISLDLLREYSNEIIEALVYLHNHSVIHKKIRASSMLFDSDGRIRLSDYSFDKRLSDLFASIQALKHGVRFSEHHCPIIGKGGKKGDVYELGVLFLSLSLGRQVTEQLPQVPTSLPAEFQDFLNRCLYHDERLRWGPSQLLEHAFLKERIPANFLNLSLTAGGTQENKGIKSNLDPDEEGTEGVPFVTAYEASGHSRMTSEFEVLRSLGKGGFGDVIKVRNKLDGRLYAIKRIRLIPKSKQFNRKITREVKLLSRLSHENVVRYYNSWIETSQEAVHSDASSSATETSKTPISFDPKEKDDWLKLKVDGNKTDEWDSLPDYSVEWSQWFEPVAANKETTDSSSEDEENYEFGASFLPKSDSEDGIVFADTSDSTDQCISEEPCSTKKNAEDNEDIQSPELVRLQYLYIQMEYCEKSTLRNCIDDGLYSDVTRVWRLFREIIEGLLHIHEQGMIHRDLKPVNIFLDSNDHVKIGDFGLATTSIIAKSSFLDATILVSSVAESHSSSSVSGASVADSNLTGKVGTALYVSPEVMEGGAKVNYTERVDIYSLGVIFFEMCYRPLMTGMERVTILSSLRLPAIQLPEDYLFVEMARQAKIIKWLLCHDPNLRPTSKELLQSDALPPLQQEEAHYQEILRSTISKPESSGYKRMVKALINQEVSAANDILYDNEFYKENAFNQRNALIMQVVQDKLIHIFKKHGAVKLSIPSLIPKSSLYQHTDQYVYMMDHEGGMVGLPFDHRVPFARYLSRYKIPRVKRYCLEKVFRRRKVYGSHLQERIECAFDVVTSNSNILIPDAEVLLVVQEIINEFPSLQERNYYLRINHMSLLKAVMLHVGIPEDKHNEVLGILEHAQQEKERREVMIRSLCALDLSEAVVTTLLNRLQEADGPYGKIASMLRYVTKTRGLAGSLAKKGLHELEAILNHAEALGFNMQVKISLELVYNVQQYSGLIFQVLYLLKKKRHEIPKVLAVGGRFDKLIEFFDDLHKSPSINQSAVGVSIAFEKIMASMMNYEELTYPCDILVCTIGNKPLLKERLSVVKELWASSLKAEILYETIQDMEDILDTCRKRRISFLVFLKDFESGYLKVRSLRDRTGDKKLTTTEMVEYLQQKLLVSKLDSTENQSSQNNTDTLHNSSNSGTPTLYFTFISQDQQRLPLNAKRKYEAQIYGKLNPVLHGLSSKSSLEVVAVDLHGSVLKSVAANLELDESRNFDESIRKIIDQHRKQRQYLTEIFDHIHEMKFKNKCNMLILYGLKDDSYKVLC